MAHLGIQAQRQGHGLTSHPFPQMSNSRAPHVNPPQPFSLDHPMHPPYIDGHRRRYVHRPTMSEPSYVTPTSVSVPSDFAPVFIQPQPRSALPSQYTFPQTAMSMSAGSPFSSGSSSSHNIESPLSEPSYETMGEADAGDYAVFSNDLDYGYGDPGGGSNYGRPSTASGQALAVTGSADAYEFSTSNASMPIGWPQSIKKTIHGQEYPQHLRGDLPQFQGGQQFQISRNEQSTAGLIAHHRIRSLPVSATGIMFARPSSSHRAPDMDYTSSGLDWNSNNAANVQLSAHVHGPGYAPVKEEQPVSTVYTSSGHFTPSANYGEPSTSYENVSSVQSSGDQYSQQGQTQGTHAFPMLYDTADGSRTVMCSTRVHIPSPQPCIDPASVSPVAEQAYTEQRFVQGPGIGPISHSQIPSGESSSSSSSSLTLFTGGPDSVAVKREEHNLDLDADGEDEDGEGEYEDSYEYLPADEDYRKQCGGFVSRRRCESNSAMYPQPPLRSLPRSATRMSRYTPYSSPPANAEPPLDSARPRRHSTASITSVPSPTAPGISRRARHSTPLPTPVPVPNLTKKSRGRRVPTVYGPADDELGGDNGTSWVGTRSYTCTVDGCGKCFARGEHLKRHVRSIHTYEKPHTCPYPGCGKQFSRYDNLGQHMRVHKDFSAPRNGRQYDPHTSSV